LRFAAFGGHTQAMCLLAEPANANKTARHRQPHARLCHPLGTVVTILGQPEKPKRRLALSWKSASLLSEKALDSGSKQSQHGGRIKKKEAGTFAGKCQPPQRMDEVGKNLQYKE